MSSPHYTVEYRLTMPDGAARSHTLRIDAETMTSEAPSEPAPAWATLAHQRCEGCILPEGQTHCPVAVRLAEPLRRFSTYVSHTMVEAEVVTEERTYRKTLDLQEALRSLFGLIIATSGCPKTRAFRLMARYHLPFSTLEETIWRVVTTHLLMRHFEDRDADLFDTADIASLYEDMETVNHSLATRLQGVAETDGGVNAIVIFSSFSALIPLMIEEELERLRLLLTR